MNKGMKFGQLLSLVICVFTCYMVFTYQENIYLFYRDNILKAKANLVLEKNEYYKEENYSYVSNTTDFVAKDKEHLLDILFTIINSGETDFRFYCDTEYKDCVNDIEIIASDEDILSDLNNFVHPYNSFTKLYAAYSQYGDITITTEKNYTDEEISQINVKVDEIINKEINAEMTNKEKITKIHNYLINNSTYVDDETYSKATNLLFDKKGLCMAYSDTIAIFLEKFDINNYKVASKNHVWNLVYINNTWLHLDLTWDDPVISDGSQRLEYYFLLIDTARLKELDSAEHNFDETIYIEAKK